ncbi:MAG: SipW-dependent-type signal peptide-containing protein [Bifidobacteriaceae bacterium]|nr:SipW-dependent-type signal peptide-containing protein [Bifidobacteriaceae bacterium]
MAAAGATKERERRSRRFKGLVAGVTGLALLMGGSTYALWSDSSSANVEPVQHGTLDIEGSLAPVVYDVRVAKGPSDPDNSPWINGLGGKKNRKVITDLSKFYAVPGDNLEINIPVDVTAIGDNMKYELWLDDGGKDGQNTFQDSDWIFLVYVFRGDDLMPHRLPDGDDLDIKKGFDSVRIDWDLDPEDLGELRVAITAELPAATTGRQNSALDLADLHVTVKQVDPYAKG